MKLIWIIFFAVASFSIKESDATARSDSVSVTISNEYIPSKKSSKQYLPAFDTNGYHNDSQNVNENNAHSYRGPTHLPYQYLPPVENNQIQNENQFSETKPSTQQYLLPAEVKQQSYQFLPSSQYMQQHVGNFLPLFQEREHYKKYDYQLANDQQYHNQYTTPMNADKALPQNDNSNPSNEAFGAYQPHSNIAEMPHQYLPPLSNQNSNDYSTSLPSNSIMQFRLQNIDDEMSQYSTHSPIPSIPNKKIDRSESYQNFSPSENSRISYSYSSIGNPQEINRFSPPYATRRYDDQTQSMNTQSNQNVQNPTPSSYSYMFSSPEKTTASPMYQQNYQFPNQYPTTPIETYKTTEAPKLFRPEYQNQFTTQSPAYDQSNTVQNQYAQSRNSGKVYGDKIIPTPPQYATSRSSTVLSPQASEKTSDPVIIGQPNKYIPQLPTQFKPSSPIEMPHNQFQQQPTYMGSFHHPASFQSGPTTEAIPILKQSVDMDADGSFNYETLTGDQTHVMQHGHIENPGTDHEEQVMQGSYSFVADDGKTYTVTYIADSNGFRASGDHLPTPPPIPEVIQRSIDFNLAEEAAMASQKQTPHQEYQYPQMINNHNHLPPAQAKERSFHEHGYNY